MAQRRSLQSLARLITSSSSAVSARRSLKTLNPILPAAVISSSSNSFLPNSDAISWGGGSVFSRNRARHLSSGSRDDDDEEDDDDDDEGDEDDETDYSDEDGTEGAGGLSDSNSKENPSGPVDKVARAAEIGYQVIGSLKPSDKVFKPYEPVYAVVQIGSHQFKVSNGDSIFTEKLKYCDINDKLILNKVMLLGSPTETIVGRPIVPGSAVHAVVEEHALDAKVIIFKKKRRKNYRRCNGHRQELTKLRITDIEGITKPEIVEQPKPTKAKATTTTVEQQEKVAVAA
ncbi:50S ribosomal protein L21, mitochondrial [Linum perenne]